MKLEVNGVVVGKAVIDIQANTIQLYDRWDGIIPAGGERHAPFSTGTKEPQKFAQSSPAGLVLQGLLKWCKNHWEDAR